MADPLSPDRQAAVNYADTYAEHPNSSFGEINPDCTDFVSQSLQAGGFNTDEDWSPWHGYLNPLHNPQAWLPWSEKFREGQAATKAWASAQDLQGYLLSQEGGKTGGPTGTALSPISANPFNDNPDPNALKNAGLKPGDIVFYDWGDKNPDGSPVGIEHSAVYVGQQKTKLPDGTEVMADVVDYHTNDKKWQFWALPASGDDGKPLRDRTVTYHPVHVTYPDEPGAQIGVPMPPGEKIVEPPVPGTVPSPPNPHASEAAAHVPLSHSSLWAQTLVPAVGVRNLTAARRLPWRTFADGGEVEGRGQDYDDGPLSTSRSGSLFPFLQWHNWANIASSTNQQFQQAGGQLAQAVAPLVFADGGEVDEHGPDDGDSGFLSRSHPGSLFPFLQWHDWASIVSNTNKQVEQAGGVAGVAALAAAATGGVGAAATAAVTALTTSVGTVLQQFTAPAQTQGNGLPKATPLPLQVPMSDGISQTSFGPQIDRTMTVNVIKPGAGKSGSGMWDRLQQQVSTYLSHIS